MIHLPKYWNRRLFALTLLLSSAFAFDSLAITISPDGTRCWDPDIECCYSSACGALGYGYIDGPHDYCYNDMCNQVPPQQTPEMSDYVAAAFIGLALLVGWHTRRYFSRMLH